MKADGLGDASVLTGVVVEGVGVVGFQRQSPLVQQPGTLGVPFVVSKEQREIALDGWVRQFKVLQSQLAHF
jgi:hypothetical protein